MLKVWGYLYYGFCSYFSISVFTPWVQYCTREFLNSILCLQLDPLNCFNRHHMASWPDLLVSSKNLTALKYKFLTHDDRVEINIFTFYTCAIIWGRHKKLTHNYFSQFLNFLMFEYLSRIFNSLGTVVGQLKTIIFYSYGENTLSFCVSVCFF